MQEPARSLSVVQRHSLESAYACFKGVTAFLESLENKLAPDERLMSQNFRDLAGMCEQKLVTAWPEILPWLEEWKRGGVS